MAFGDLIQADFALAFTLVRGEAGAVRDATGTPTTAAINAPRFDHGADGAVRGLLVTPGSDIGLQDRLAIEPLMLPVELTDGTSQDLRACTVFHVFRPAPQSPTASLLEAIEGFEPEEWAAGIERRAWYSRNARATIDALLAQTGHHLELGVIAGFRENLGGFVRLRGQVWQLAGLLAADPAGVLDDGAGRPIVLAGAEMVDG